MFISIKYLSKYKQTENKYFTKMFFGVSQDGLYPRTGPSNKTFGNFSNSSKSFVVYCGSGAVFIKPLRITHKNTSKKILESKNILGSKLCLKVSYQASQS